MIQILGDSAKCLLEVGLVRLERMAQQYGKREELARVIVLRARREARGQVEHSILELCVQGTQFSSFPTPTCSDSGVELVH